MPDSIQNLVNKIEEEKAKTKEDKLGLKQIADEIWEH